MIQYLNKYLFISFFSIVCCTINFAQPSVRASLDTNKILIGDQVNLNLSIRTPKNIQVSPPNLSFLDSVKNVEVVSIGERDTAIENNLLNITQQLRITSFDSGAVFIPAIPFRYNNNGQNGFVSTNQLRLDVGTPVVDSLILNPIKPIVTEPFRLEDALPVVYALLGIGLLSLLIWWWLSRKGKEKKVIEKPVIVIPAHEIALEKLAALKVKELWQKGEIKAYQSELTYIVREYLENRYDIAALESTTDEILRDLKGTDINEGQVNQLREMLQMADMVKFAKATPPVDIHEQLMDRSEQLVRDTKKIITETPPEVPTQEENSALLFIPLATSLWSDQIEFVNPGFFILLGLIPLVAIWYYMQKRERYASLKMPSLESVKNTGSWRTYTIPFLYLLRALAFVAFVIALARPQLTLKEEEITADGIDIVLVMDLSSSMLAQDFKPDRLEVSKRVASDFIDKRQYDRIGLVVFAGEAFTQCPLTTDHRILKDFLAGLECGILEDGTAIGMGLATAVNRLQDSEAKSKVVILLTDGDNNAGYVKPLTAAEIAREFNVKAYTIGVGSRGKALAPVSRRSDGRYIFGMASVQIDEALLKEISRMTDGRYYRATSAEGLQDIYAEIDRLEKTEIEVTSIKRYNEEFHTYALWGLAFLLIELLLRFLVFRSIP